MQLTEVPVHAEQLGSQFTHILRTLSPYCPVGQVATQVEPLKKKPVLHSWQLVADTEQRLHLTSQGKHDPDKYSPLLQVDLHWLEPKIILSPTPGNPFIP